MSATTYRSVTPENLRDLLQAMGYPVDLAKGQGDMPILRSATSGLAFEIRFLNPAQDGKGYADMTFLAALPLLDGRSPLEIANRWNASMRFARLQVNNRYLVLAMDVIALGGVQRDHLVTQIEVWDRLLQQVRPFLRDAIGQAGAASAA
jgi:hypothetical protein